MRFTPEGVFPALPTPINEDGSINFEAAENHLEFLEENGVHGVVPAGCTGHAATLGDQGSDNLEYDEHVEFVSRIAEVTDLPVIAGDGMNSTQQTLELASSIENEADIDAYLMLSLYQNCPSGSDCGTLQDSGGKPGEADNRLQRTRRKGFCCCGP
jgi:4-hydroxy-tetrahydrodipicolinate synthase